MITEQNPRIYKKLIKEIGMTKEDWALHTRTGTKTIKRHLSGIIDPIPEYYWQELENQLSKTRLI